MRPQEKAYSLPSTEISQLMISRIFGFPANENQPPAICILIVLFIAVCCVLLPENLLKKRNNSYFFKSNGYYDRYKQ